MRVMSLRIVGAGGALLVAMAALPAPSYAQITNGPWFQTRDCRPQRAGPRWLPRGPAMPGTPSVGGGYQQPTECRWERTVRRCPRVFRSLRDCSERRERSGYSPTRPRD